MNTTLEVKERIKYNFMARANVVGVGIGEEGVTVMVTQKLPLPALDTKDIIPKVILGQPTDVIQVGEIRALSDTGKWRPAPGGVSIGHYKITAGTFGAPVQDEETGELLMLSNNHVLANSNNAEIGDPIYQPGPYDGGNANDTIARLSRFVPIQFGTDGGTCPWADGYAKIGNLLAKIFDSNHRVSVYQVRPLVGNLVDAAVAKPINDSDVADYVLGIGVVSGTEGAYLGMGVCKSGRTTGYTEGKVTLTMLPSKLDMAELELPRLKTR